MLINFIRSIFYAFVCILFIQCSQQNKGSITIGCASNMRIAMDSIITVFELESNVKVNLLCNSSGMLYSQIEQGAPIDIFVSANHIYTDALFESKNCTQPKTLALGALYLAIQKPILVNNLKEVLFDKKIKRIGIPNTETAPFGMAAKKHLEKTNLYDLFTGRMIVGESISQISQYLQSNAIDAGFVSNSFKVKNEESFHYLKIEIENTEDLEHFVTQVIRPQVNNSKIVIEFINFLSSQKSKEILHHYGYTVQ